MCCFLSTIVDNILFLLLSVEIFILIRKDMYNEIKSNLQGVSLSVTHELWYRPRYIFTVLHQHVTCHVHNGKRSHSVFPVTCIRFIHVSWLWFRYGFLVRRFLLRCEIVCGFSHHRAFRSFKVKVVADTDTVHLRQVPLVSAICIFADLVRFGNVINKMHQFR